MRVAKLIQADRLAADSYAKAELPWPAEDTIAANNTNRRFQIARIIQGPRTRNIAVKRATKSDCQENEPKPMNGGPSEIRA